MSGTIYHLEGDPPVAVRLRKSARAKRLSLRVSRVEGRVSLTMPRFVSEREALAFVHEKAEWLRAQVSQAAPKTDLQFGAKFPFRGVDHELVQGQGRSVRIENGQIHIPAKDDMLRARLQAFLKMQARLALQKASQHYAEKLDTSFGKISIRDTKSRWGSCTSDGNLMYSWRLIMAPDAVLDYVAAHEVAHRLEMNHSAAYWANVARVYPAYAAQKNWLKVHGAQLHAWDFSRPTS